MVAVKNIQKAKVNLDRDVLLELKEVIKTYSTSCVLSVICCSTQYTTLTL